VEAKAWQAFYATLLLERSKFGLNELLGDKLEAWVVNFDDGILKPGAAGNAAMNLDVSLVDAELSIDIEHAAIVVIRRSPVVGRDVFGDVRRLSLIAAPWNKVARVIDNAVVIVSHSGDRYGKCNCCKQDLHDLSMLPNT